MPELPEVETVVRQLAPFAVGQKIRRIDILDSRLDEAELQRARGRAIQDVRRSGKQVIFDLSTLKSPLYLCAHLRMTGRLIIGPLPANIPHLRAVLELDHGEVGFVDPRRFGTLRIFHDPAAFAPKGIEPLSDAFTEKALRELLARSSQAIKLWLLRQDRLVGLGNIYASEILFAARISPERPARSLQPNELRRLHRATVRILEAAIECCGTTFSDFQTARGQEGAFGAFLKVYGKEGLPCPRCRRPLNRIVQGQRSTFFCGACQS